MKILFAAVAALSVAAPAIAVPPTPVSTVIDFFGFKPGTDYLAASFGDYELSSNLTFGNGTHVFTSSGGKPAIGAFVSDADTIGGGPGTGDALVYLRRSDGAAFNLDAFTLASSGTPGTVTLSHGDDKTSYYATDGQSIEDGFINQVSYKFVFSVYGTAGTGTGLSGLTVSVLDAGGGGGGGGGTGTVPEPATWAMFIAGFGVVGVARRRRGGGVVTAA